MDQMLQNRIKSLLGGADMPNLMTTEMPSDAEMKNFSSVSMLPQSQSGDMVEGKDYLNIGGQFFWPWELESALPNGVSDTKAISRFLESLPEKPAIKELQLLQGIVGQGGLAKDAAIKKLNGTDDMVSFKEMAMARGMGGMPRGSFSEADMKKFRMARGMAEGGEVDQAEMMMMESSPNGDLEQTIMMLMQEQQMTDDPDEQKSLQAVGENLQAAAQAPMAEQAAMLAAEGRNGDTRLAHLRVGEVVLPPEAFEDEQFESMVGAKFKELDLDPEQYVVGGGIASLNPITGLEEFGWFKKTFKSLKKVAKVVAPLAMFIPGIGTAIGAALGGIGGLAASIPGLSTVAGAIPGLSKLGGLAKTALGGLGSLGIPGISPIAGGISQGVSGGALSTIGGALKNPLAGGIFGGKGSTYGGFNPGGAENQDFFRKTLDKFMQAAPKTTAEDIQKKLEQGVTPEEIAKQLETQQPGILQQFMSGLGGMLGMGAGGSGGIGSLLPLLAAGGLGKLAYDEAKNMRGVPLTPLTQEGSTGRYNIEAEIARRSGQPAPNPVEFGLLPAGTIPTLSGGRATPETVAADPVGVTDPAMEETPVMARYGGAIMSARNGGYVMPMAYKKGGKVSTEDFERMNGGINGEGTETSDDVPAMLSDGEFVMTGQAVRGAGAFDLGQGEGGIITLTPNGGENRDGGTALMYEMMDLFAEFADKPKSKRRKKAA
jgi:hypothetical protein